MDRSDATDDFKGLPVAFYARKARGRACGALSEKVLGFGVFEEWVLGFG
jgi:hypothetical protein